jgi:hypothetical protein
MVMNSKNLWNVGLLPRDCIIGDFRSDYGDIKHLWNVGLFYVTTQCNSPEDYLHTRRRENLKSHITLYIRNEVQFHSVIAIKQQTGPTASVVLIGTIQSHNKDT